MPVIKNSAVFVLSNRERFMEWIKNVIRSNPGIPKGDAAFQSLRLAFDGHTLNILVFRDNYEDADSFSVVCLKDDYDLKEIRFTTDGELFPYNPNHFGSEDAFKTMFEAITDFMEKMPLYLIVLDKSNVIAQFRSRESLGIDWDRGAHIPSPEVLVGVFRAPDEQSALEAAACIDYKKEMFKAYRLV